MAVSKRNKDTDTNYSSAMGGLENPEGRQPVVGDVISDLRDDVNDLCDLANKVDKLTFDYKPKSGSKKAELVITHADGTKFTLTA